MMLLLSSIPPILLLLFAKKLPPVAKYALQLLSIPFFILLTLYSIIFGLALAVCCVVIYFVFSKYLQKKASETRIYTLIDQ